MMNTPTPRAAKPAPKPFWATDRTISHGEAKEIAQRLINSHFRKEPGARVGIPARPDYDDDLLILAYIEQQARLLDEREAELKRLRDELADLQRTFDLQWDADQRAIKQWQAAHPGNDLVWPDRCNMVVWLLDRLRALCAAKTPENRHGQARQP